MITELDASQSAHGLKYICSECTDGDTATIYYPELTPGMEKFTRKELPAGTAGYTYKPYKSQQEELALEELKKCCI